MNLRIALIIIGSILLLGLTASIGCGNSTNITSIQANVSGAGGGIPSPGDGNGTLMQDDNEPDEEEPAEGDDSEDGSESEEGDEPADEEPSEDETTPSMGDILGQPVDAMLGDENLQNALAGIADYEVTYDSTRSRAENTPQALRTLGVTYAGEESTIAQRTKLLDELDILATLDGWYEDVEDVYAADPETDFDPDDDDPHSLNYFEPRENPFVITELIPEELRPELEGTGLDGVVDPEVLAELFWAEYAANLRLIPIIIVGTIQAGNNRGCIYSIGGWSSRWIEEGQSHCMRWGAPFSLSCTQVSEDFVVLTLRGTSDWGCRYAATGPIVRTFHISR